MPETLETAIHTPVGTSADTADEVGVPQPRRSWLHRWAVPISAGALVALAAIAVCRMESSVADYDPQYMRALVERAMRYGGSYYSNGIHNKGPLEPVVYEVAARVGGHDGFWLVIALFTLLAAVSVGVGAGVVAWRAGAAGVVAVSIATVAAVHLTLSDADYAGVLYTRNMNVALLSAALAIGAVDRAWTTARRRLLATVSIAFAVGLAAQTLLTAAITAMPIVVWILWTRRDVRIGGRPLWLVLPFGSAAVLLSAPAYYRLFGPWRDFVDGWWTYARFMNQATGRGLPGQIALGWDRCFEYYRDRPALAIVLQLWLISTAVQWSRLDVSQRALRMMAAGWWLAGWFELTLSQRYSSHYYSVVAVPTLMLIAILIGDVARRLPVWRASVTGLLPLLAAAGTIGFGGTGGFGVGVEAAATVSGVHDFEQRRDRGLGGRQHVLHAALDLVSDDGDPLLMWTTYPWPYLDLDRVSATRYIWKTFLMGEIYLGQSGPEYVLPGTWERFERDLDRSDPTAFLVETVTPVAEDTPFEERVQRDFTPVFADETATLSFRNDLADWLLSPPDEASVQAIGVEAPYVLADSRCVRFDGELIPDDGDSLVLAFGPTAERAAVIAVSMGEAGLVASSFAVGVNSYATGIDRAPSGPNGGYATTLVVGDRSAVLVVEGSIVAGVGLDADRTARIAEGIDWIGGGALRRSSVQNVGNCEP